MSFEYLREPDVLIAHHTAITLFGGSSGVRDRKALDSCLKQPEQQFSGQDLYPDLWAKAAAYAYFICQNHPFVDGNKRTAAIAANTFLALNGYRLSPPAGEIERMFLKIATGKVKIEEIAVWMKESATPYSV
ncbi:MAG: hypothetical protein A2Z21_04240 [Candidatus Fraserbacteria bacterium RBG_16_55_9]|uniref:Fido domain-containing protein n=1 Tax=Fraserbacteria sp. (strain RBG_16_55_9) TaxID=1817864 RepID=A0A1F5UP01_FRAXR|nr:MAG: hypothetical protein A2Z21_04240 [Candidatus Fraserbacteria bacterium RBG_16_55_9]